jgi:hypothetical protein
MNFVRSILALAAASLAMALLATPAGAELSGNFVVWENFAAIANQADIPYVLGVVDGITRIGGNYYVVAGKCYVQVFIDREAPKSEGGNPVGGGSHIAGVKLGPKHCKP